MNPDRTTSGSDPARSIFGPDVDPLASDAPEVWAELIEAVGPASMLVAIDARMSARLRESTSAEDILQETLLVAWSDRRLCGWRGITSFRRWLLTLADHRLKNIAEAQGAQKRGGGTRPIRLDAGLRRDGSSIPASIVPASSTTPSRVASERELAHAMQSALQALPDDLRDVVRLRLFEGLLLDEIAAQLAISEPSVRRRFRRGAELYREQLARVAGSTWQGNGGATLSDASPAS